MGQSQEDAEYQEAKARGDQIQELLQSTLKKEPWHFVREVEWIRPFVSALADVLGDQSAMIVKLRKEIGDLKVLVEKQRLVEHHHYHYGREGLP